MTSYNTHDVAWARIIVPALVHSQSIPSCKICTLSSKHFNKYLIFSGILSWVKVVCLLTFPLPILTLLTLGSNDNPSMSSARLKWSTHCEHDDYPSPYLLLLGEVISLQCHCEWCDVWRSSLRFSQVKDSAWTHFKKYCTSCVMITVSLTCVSV